jgi:hypothetical protein
MDERRWSWRLQDVDAFNIDELTSTQGGEIVGTTTRDLQQA